MLCFTQMAIEEVIVKSPSYYHSVLCNQSLNQSSVKTRRTDFTDKKHCKLDCHVNILFSANQKLKGHFISVFIKG